MPAAPASPRRDYRAEIPSECVLDLSLWQGDGLRSGSTIDPEVLGEPIMRRDASRSYSLHVDNISAGGMNLRIHNPRITPDKAAAFMGRTFLTKLDLDEGGSDRLTFLLLSQARRAEPVRGGALVAFQFMARARFVKSAGVLQLFALRNRGVDNLASWVARCAIRPEEIAPSLPERAWYEALA